MELGLNPFGKKAELLLRLSDHPKYDTNSPASSLPLIQQSLEASQSPQGQAMEEEETSIEDSSSHDHLIYQHQQMEQALFPSISPDHHISHHPHHHQPNNDTQPLIVQSQHHQQDILLIDFQSVPQPTSLEALAHHDQHSQTSSQSMNDQPMDLITHQRLEEQESQQAVSPLSSPTTNSLESPSSLSNLRQPSSLAH